jgi:hypothetical protein
MATTESRTGFRLPWSADRAASRNGSEEPGDESNIDDSLRLASAEGAPDAVPAAPADARPTADDATSAAVEPVGPVAAPTQAAEAVPARRPTKFLVDLTHAMQAAAEQARAATLEQFRIEGSSYIEQIQGRSLTDADALRRRADDDVARIKDWSKAEIARIREETENRIAGRRGQLDGQLARHAALVEREIARIERQIAAFEAEMADFFDQLLAETDLTVLAARAQQMPEAPAFDAPDGDAFSELLTEPAVGMPFAGPTAATKPSAEPQPTSAADDEVADDRTESGVMVSPAGDTSFDRDAAMMAIQASAEAAAALESEAAALVETEPVAEAAAPDLVPEAGPDDAATPVDHRLDHLGLSPDFAAAETAAAESAAAEVQDIPEMDEANLAARLAGLVPLAPSGAPGEEASNMPLVSTQVIVNGLVSVASIASFKRYLSRADGVRHVGVSSGPDGEFLFTVQHQAEVSLRDVIPTLPGFQARVTGGGGGVVTASAHDPED